MAKRTPAQHSLVASAKLAGAFQPCTVPLPCQSQQECAVHTEAGSSFATLPEAMEEHLRKKHRLRDAISALSFNITTTLWNCNICHCCPGDTSGSSGLKASMAYNWGLKGLYIFAYFKAAAGGSGFQSAWNWCWWDPSLCNTDKSLQTFKNWPLSSINQAAKTITNVWETTKSLGKVVQ